LNRIRVLVADDQDMYRQMMVSTLGEEEDLEVVGEASNGAEAIELCRMLLPDIILLDINMPRMNGVEVTRDIVRKCPQTKVVILSAFDDDAYVLELAQVGAKGYMLKESHSNEVLRAIRAAHANDSLWEPKIQNKVLREMGRLLDERTKAQDQQAAPLANEDERARERNFESLTEREREVLRLMGRGMNNREICDSLHISEPTVKTHISNVMAKMGFRDRVDAALWTARRA
jgi:two-component system response regulator DegU